MLTAERAREVIAEQATFPYWGNYRKFMTADEQADVEARFRRATSGSVTIASIVHAIAREEG